MKNINAQSNQSNSLNANFTNNPNNLNISNLTSIFASKGISAQDVLNIVKNNNLANLRTLVSENSNINKTNQILNKTEPFINSPNNKASESTSNNDKMELQAKLDEKKESSDQFENSPIDSDRGSEGKENSEEERFFMLDKKPENTKNISVKEEIITQKFEKSNSIVSNNDNNFQSNMNLEELLKNPNNPNGLNGLISNENLKSALIKLLEKGDLGSFSSLSNNAMNPLSNLNSSNITYKPTQDNPNDSKPHNKNAFEKTEKASIMKDLGEDKPKDPRRKKKDTK